MWCKMAMLCTLDSTFKIFKSIVRLSLGSKKAKHDFIFTHC
jgi:hypothetical protein